MKITIVAGARPNFVKIAPILQAIHNINATASYFSFRVVHTGQHYDEKMSRSFFDELNIPQPDINLECGGGTQAEQTASIMISFERDLKAHPCDIVIVVGDVTSTMACAIVAKKMNTKVAHVEAGIRSFDLTMPEEINRMVTDSITDIFFTTSETANQNLIKSGVPKHRIFFVGNVMIDTLLQQKSNFRKPIIFDTHNLKKGQYFILTLHRPSNVDSVENLKLLLFEIVKAAGDLQIIFPIHPRTAKLFLSLNINYNNLIVIDPLSYLEFNFLVQYAKAVITDSGGITEETTVLGIPCLTLRENTERPETCTIGTNQLIGTNPKNVAPNLQKIISGNWKKGDIPPLWDGKSAQRIVNHLLDIKIGPAD